MIGLVNDSIYYYYVLLSVHICYWLPAAAHRSSGAARRCGGGATKLHIKATMRILIYMRLSNALASCLFLSYSFLPFFIFLSHLRPVGFVTLFPWETTWLKVYGNEARQAYDLHNAWLHQQTCIKVGPGRLTAKAARLKDIND